MKIRIIDKSIHNTHEYSIEASAGMDIRASLNEDLIIEPMQCVLIQTGIFLENLNSFKVLIRARNRLEINKRIEVLNSPGAIDSDYRGEV